MYLMQKYDNPNLCINRVPHGISKDTKKQLALDDIEKGDLIYTSDDNKYLS